MASTGNARAAALANNLGAHEQVMNVDALATALGHAGERVDDTLREQLATEMAGAGVDADFGGSGDDMVRLRGNPSPAEVAPPNFIFRSSVAPAASAPDSPTGPTHVEGRTPMSTPPATPDLDSQGDAIFWAVTLLVSFFPAIGYELVPGGQLDDKGTVFWTVYLTTLPWSGSLTLIFLMYRRNWLAEGTARLWASAGLLIGSAVLGWGFGSSQADLQFITHTHGNIPEVVAQVVFYVVATYAYLYGLVLWLGGVLAGAWAAYWLDHKLPK